jgi:hypothetical protein
LLPTDPATMAARDRRFTSGAVLSGRMVTAAGIAASMIAGRHGHRRKCRLAGSSGLIHITWITIACAMAAAMHRTSGICMGRRK